MRLFLLLIALTFLSPPAVAQQDESQIFVTPGARYTNNGEIVRQLKKEQSFAKIKKTEPDTINLSFVHHSYMEPRQFGIMMSVPNAMIGCFKFSPLEYEASFIDRNYMDIKVDSFRRKLVKDVNVAADCNTRNQTISALVVVSADDLERRGIQKIRFNNGKHIDYFKVSITGQSITFEPESMVAFKPTNLTGINKDRVVHYFNGAETIVALHVPMAEKQDDVTNALRKLAYQSSLVPLFESDALDTSGKSNIFYFTDPNHSLLEGLNPDGYLELGEISVGQSYLNENGTVRTGKKLKVFATRPETKL